jgi:hypothetical protein
MLSSELSTYRAFRNVLQRYRRSQVRQRGYTERNGHTKRNHRDSGQLLKYGQELYVERIREKRKAAGRFIFLNTNLIRTHKCPLRNGHRKEGTSGLNAISTLASAFFSFCFFFRTELRCCRVHYLGRVLVVVTFAGI